MDHLIKNLIERLIEKGVEITAIPTFLRNLAYTMSSEPSMDLSELNRRMDHLGWAGIDLDYKTVQLVVKNIEPHNRKSP